MTELKTPYYIKKYDRIYFNLKEILLSEFEMGLDGYITFINTAPFKAIKSIKGRNLTSFKVAQDLCETKKAPMIKDKSGNEYYDLEGFIETYIIEQKARWDILYENKDIFIRTETLIVWDNIKHLTTALEYCLNLIGDFEDAE